MTEPRNPLYHSGSRTMPMPRRSRKRPPPPCPCCGQHGGFCDTHRERLNDVRDELNTSGFGKGPWKKRDPMCCTIGCHNRRLPPAGFCAECLDAAG